MTNRHTRLNLLETFLSGFIIRVEQLSIQQLHLHLPVYTGSGACNQTPHFSVDVSTTRPWDQDVPMPPTPCLWHSTVLDGLITPIRLKAADVNNTGSINSGDALMIMKDL